MNYHLNTRAIEIDPHTKHVSTSTLGRLAYDILVLATGSNSILPSQTPGYDANGVFVYRTITDLEKLMEFSLAHEGTVGAAVGGGLLGLEAAKAMVDLKCFSSVKVIDRNSYLLARQLDADAGGLVTSKVRELGVDVIHRRRIRAINVDGQNNVVGATFEDGDKIDCSCLCFAVFPYPFLDHASPFESFGICMNI